MKSLLRGMMPSIVILLIILIAGALWRLVEWGTYQDRED